MILVPYYFSANNGICQQCYIFKFDEWSGILAIVMSSNYGKGIYGSNTIQVFFLITQFSRAITDKKK